jgi:hypothetical protein
MTEILLKVALNTITVALRSDFFHHMSDDKLL